MKYEVVKSKYAQDTWVVEAINLPGEGEIFAACFDGPDAQQRAEEYATWKNGGVIPNSHFADVFATTLATIAADQANNITGRAEALADLIVNVATRLALKKLEDKT